ncbi:MAG: acetate--CoA ligase family protein [Candidatus Bipolaricaulota bacterium]|nr:acetate--CoA ligase family protein [Candidatus Bipolaricaulota bacterium]MDW8031229.1 acetate--CoA ligase family protein [Candidatus Bipolaricaulota bacterium]
MTLYTRETLEALFAPQSVAVIGASTKPDSLGRAVFKNVLFSGYTGVVYPVHPKARSILGVKAYPSVLDIPDEIDLAVIIVPAAAVAEVLDECGRKGVRASIVISAGFKEIGEEGAKREAELQQIARRYGIALLGPNCLGIINTDPKVSLNATFAHGMPRQGNIAFISQSGALGVAALEYAQRQKIGLSKFISIGNKADLHENHLLEYLKDDPLTDVILLYVEDLEDPRGFHKLATEITSERPKKIPILAIKSGRTLEGAKAATSHTGALAGSDEVYDSVFMQSGVLRVETIEELFDYAVAFAQQPLPKGNEIAIVTNAGGAGILATDAAVRYGLRLASFTHETTQRLRELLPPTINVANPVDMTGEPNEQRYDTIVRTVLADPNVQGVIVIAAPHILMSLENIARNIVRAVQETQSDKPVLTCLMAVTDARPAVEILETINIPNYSFPERAARALAAMARYQEWVHRPRTEYRIFRDIQIERAREIIAHAKRDGRRLLLEPEAHDLLKAFGFPVLKYRLAQTEDEALAAAHEIGYPVVLKIVSPDIAHKVDVGGVKLNIQSDSELRASYRQVLADVTQAKPTARIVGVFVQEFIKDGKETILGLKRDPLFGPLLMFGLGGIYVEALRDVTFRLAPVRELGIQRMIRQIRGFKILEGFRGEPPSDIDTIAECLARLSQLATQIEEIVELDINPLVVLKKGHGARVVDARIVVA